jgi:N-acyl-D-amino-acid deacylase
MADFDLLIRGGMIVDGTGAPRHRSDLGIKDGKIADIGIFKPHRAKKVLDAGGMVVAPGFIDLHTHYDAQVFWDPYCSISGWHGVTSVVIGNCGFGFAPVHPEARDRAMQSLSRVEAIPYTSMKAGMPWDWVMFPEFLQSLDRTPKGINMLPYVPVAPILIWVMGLDDAKSGRLPTDEEHQAMCKLIHEGMEAGGCGWSAQRLGPNSVQMDFDGRPMVTDIMHNETALAFARVLGERNEGFIQMTYLPGSGAFEDLTRHFEEIAAASGRPIIMNAIQASDRWPDRHRALLAWLETCHERGIRIYGQAVTTDAGFVMALKDWNLWDDNPAWLEVCLGTVEEKKKKMSELHRRPALRADPSGLISNTFDDIFVFEVRRPDNKRFENMSLSEIGKEQGKHPVDAMLDLAVSEDLETEFYAPSIGRRLEYLREILDNDMTLLGLSDGGAHTKFFTAGRYPTESITRLVRDNEVLSLEDVHRRLSAWPAWCAGFRDRGTLREGAPADVVVYDFANLKALPMEVARDLPGGEWRRVQRAEGYRWVLVNGEITIEGDQPTGKTPGRLLRHGR